MSTSVTTRGAPSVGELRVSTYTVPTDAPESDGTLEWDATTIVVVEAPAGEQRGVGYTYGDQAVAALIDGKLSDVVVGSDALSPGAAFAAMRRETRNLGAQGIASMAISAIDAALWDLKARILGIPLCALLGAVRESVPAYGSGGFTSYSDEQLRDQLSGWAAQGLRMVKMKVGRDPDRDPHRVRVAREAIGPDVELFVDGNGAYSRAQALGAAQEFRAIADVTWFEEPVTSDDLAGLRLLRDRAPAGMAIAAGEYGWTIQDLRRMVDAGAVDVLQADSTRCGGVTGMLDAGALCRAANIPLSAHCAPAQHVHVALAIERFVHLEYFHDHVRIESMLFDRVPELRDGALWPDLSKPGNGLELDRTAAARYAV